MTYDEMKKMLGNGFSQKETIEVLQMLQGKRLKVFIDAYKEKPFMLLCRSRNNKAEVIIKDNRIQIQNHTLLPASTQPSGHNQLWVPR